MNIILQFLAKFVRKKIALWGIATALLVFLICAYSGAYSGAPRQDAYREQADNVIGLHKRLHTIDNGIEPVQFLPGVPGHASPRKSGGESSYKHDSSGSLDKLYQDSVYRGHGDNKPMQQVQQGREHFIPQSQGQSDNVEYDSANSGVVNNGLSNSHDFKSIESFDSNGGSNSDYMSQRRMSGEFDPSGYNAEPYIAKQRLVHFDLKGAPPRTSYLKKILPMLKQLGATGILWEWEDTFPFTGRLAEVATINHYTHQEVQELLTLCSDLGLESIPLVQTFGHLEFILKLQNFMHLRDAEDMPESICPCHNDTMPLIVEMISQVMRLHKSARYLHIGCDEVYHLGTCAPCMDEQRNQVFVGHVGRVAQHVVQTYGVKPIIWDDMLRNFLEEEMMPLANLVEPMVWVYAEDVYRFMPSFTWDRYAAVFPNIWTASAFKGAHGETLVVPDAKRHLVNNLNWINVMREQEHKLKGGFKGIVITGWQRFDHFSVLCELLPAAIPSLFLDLLTVSNGYYNDTLNPTLLKALSCPRRNNQPVQLNLETDNFLWDTLSWCYFPGANFFRVTEKLVSLENNVGDFFDMAERRKGWFTQYDKDHHFGSSFRIDQIMEDWSRFQHETASLMKTAATALKEVFDHYTQGEWVEQKLYPIYKKLSKMRQEADALKSDKTWPKRPFPIAQSLLELGIGVAPPTTQPPPPTGQPPTPRAKRRVQSPDLYSSRGRMKNLGHR